MSRKRGNVMGVLAIIGAIYIIVRIIGEVWENARPPRGQIDNGKMFKDSMSGMSSRDLKRNYKNGKYFK